jgi:GT2 family glycosyltransferase
MRPLVVIPTYLTQPEDVSVTMTAIHSCKKTQGEGVEILAVDDGSPDPSLVDALEAETSRLKFEVHRKPNNTGFAQTVNVGLDRALASGQDAVLLNADMEMLTPDWVRACKATTDENGDRAAVVGALLSYPNHLIQHAGIYFSMLTRDFNHWYRYAPENLPEALKKRVCPVTGAFQYIRHSTLEEVGVYDPKFLLGWEDVDYCIRVFLAQKRCVYNPNVRAIHAESLFRGRPSPKVDEWQKKSFMYLMVKHRELNFQSFIPEI